MLCGRKAAWEERYLRFSVIVPVYNRTELLKAAIASVLSQTSQSFEIIVVDDGSVDDVASAVGSFADPRIVLIRQENRGASAARNRGIDAARGRHVAFLDSDDLYLPHHLAAADEALRDTDDTAFYSPVIAERSKGVHLTKPPRPLAADENMASYLMSDRGFVQTSGLVVPRRLAKLVRYREDAAFGDDTDFAIRLQLAGCKFAMADAPGVVWKDGDTLPRLSATGPGFADLGWLEDIKDRIPPSAYHGYRGWHLAKALVARRPLLAGRLYLKALMSGSYGPGLAAIVLCQILFPAKVYRNIANAVIMADDRLGIRLLREASKAGENVSTRDQP
ncbi:MAG: glycosyltransferase [Aestuariivirga sp.]|nr:glycosyltransferase [Aestuariivirga sp.]